MSSADADQILPHSEANWSTSPAAAWLIEHGQRKLTAVELLDELCRRLIAEGLPLLKVSCGMLAMHPQVFARSIVWQRGAGANEIGRGHGVQSTPLYLDSPVALIHQGAAAIRRRLDVPAPQLDFPILHDLLAEGATDYVMMPVPFINGRINYISWCTDRPGGFSTAQLTLLWSLLPLLALRLEIESAYNVTETLLTTYLGHNAARKVLAGTIQPGQGSTISAAIWYSDLRGFTAMSDRLPPAEMIATLDEYFECMARAVQSFGGEVLKFIGDGMLAIFEVQNGDMSQSACRALNSALDALARLATLNHQRAEAGKPPLRVGIGLHVGDVIYGNIGAADRLDFTVIGPAVNEVSRVEAFCVKLGRPLLTTARFQELACDPRLEGVGFHGLRGVREPQELFALPIDSVTPRVMQA